MGRGISSHLLFALMMVWLAGTIAVLMGDTAAALRDSSFPVALGLIQASGSQGVLAMLLPALCGLAAIWLILKHRRAGPILLLLYSLFWLVTLAGGALAEFLVHGFSLAAPAEWRGWLVGGTAFGTMIAGFVLMALWSIRRLRGPESRETS